MQVESLEVFAAVARYGSITGAARALRYTQSGVSRQIAALEGQTGVRLFDRQARGVTLTAEGRCLLPHAEAMLDRLTTARMELDALRGQGGGRLRIGAFPTAVAALVPQALSAFRTAHPDVTVSLVEGRTPELLRRLAAGDADIAVVSAPPDRPLEASRFDLRPLLDERLLVAVPLDHRLVRSAASARKPAASAGKSASAVKTVRLADLSEDALIVGSATDEETLIRASLPPGFHPRVDIVAADWTGKLGCVAAGLGVALIPALALRAVPADIALLRLHADDAPVRQIFAATVAGRGHPAVAQLLDHLDRAVGRLPVA